jgi:hypothetical protein
MTWTLNSNSFLMWVHDMAVKKTCADCLNCKVSAKSTDNCRLCYCAETKKKIPRKESYWLVRKICVEFEDMSA